jgi:hypothetical protein
MTRDCRDAAIRRMLWMPIDKQTDPIGQLSSSLLDTRQDPRPVLFLSALAFSSGRRAASLLGNNVTYYSADG